MRALSCSAAIAALLVGCGGVDIEDDSSDDGEGGKGAGGAAASTADASSTGATPAGPTSSASQSASTGEGAGPAVSSSGVGGSGGSGAGGSGVGGSGVGGDGGVGGSGSGGLDACDVGCRGEELCSGIHAGIDDDCDGEVDESCPCVPGTASFCFEGDPSMRDQAGCFDGTMRCGDGGEWGTCDGGAHPATSACESDDSGCHAISAWPYQIVDLHAGLGGFGAVDPDEESFAVDCPAGVSCPSPLGGDFTGLQAGRYEVTYTKTIGGNAESCTFPLDVVSRGLRVELSWNYAAGADLDLHLMKPGFEVPVGTQGSSNDCAWDNCRIDNGFPTPEWFPASAPDGDPVAWYQDVDPALNSCYFAPRGFGQQWSEGDQGCHNPRLDVDNITCSTSITDPDDPSFCASENINVDFPPIGQWMRLAVVHYSGAAAQPSMRIFCDGELVANLGPDGYSTTVTLPASGVGDQAVWFATDVAYVPDGCGGRECVVSPIYASSESPWVASAAPADGPPQPPPP